MCRSQVQQQHGKKVHTVEQSEGENDMFIGSVKMEHKKYIKVMESGETGTENEQWFENLRINEKVVTFKLDIGNVVMQTVM